MSNLIIFVLGAGPKIGLSVANAFAAKGYKVALAARSVQDGVDENGYLRLKVDLANSSEIQQAFRKVKDHLGIPSVVVYNGRSMISSLHQMPVFLLIILGASRTLLDEKDPLESISADQVNRDIAVNAVSPRFTAREAVKGFKQLPSSASRTFIMTGNMLNTAVKTDVLVFGMGKSAAAHMVGSASVAYREQGFK